MEKLLLHCCCAPCAIHTIDLLKTQYDLTLYFYNPNIFPKLEHDHRLSELLGYSLLEKIPLIIEDYRPLDFYSLTRGLEDVPEGGSRCRACFEQRLQKTSQKAKTLGFPFFTTTLTISPYKNSSVIFDAGFAAAEKTGLTFLAQDFKKKEGYKLAMQKSKEAGFYRQNYCGCEYSLKSRLAYEEEKLLKTYQSFR